MADFCTDRSSLSECTWLCISFLISLFGFGLIFLTPWQIAILASVNKPTEKGHLEPKLGRSWAAVILVADVLLAPFIGLDSGGGDYDRELVDVFVINAFVVFAV